jgi:hypothetical protein
MIHDLLRHTRIQSLKYLSEGVREGSMIECSFNASKCIMAAFTRLHRALNPFFVAIVATRISQNPYTCRSLGLGTTSNHNRPSSSQLGFPPLDGQTALSSIGNDADHQEQ